MSSAYNDLAELLELRIRDCEIDWLSLQVVGVLSGRIGNDMFMIAIDDDKLLVASATDQSGVLDVISPFITKFMKGESAICSYDLVAPDITMPTLEWNLNDPDARIMDLINGRIYSEESVENLILFNRELSDYVSKANPTELN